MATTLSFSPSRGACGLSFATGVSLTGVAK